MSWWRHLETEVPALAKLGFTQIWLPPPNKAAEKVTTTYSFENLPPLMIIICFQDGRGYDAYDLWDLGEFERKGIVETRWGTKDELLSACRVAKECGIDIIIDAVLNRHSQHKLGADRVEQFPAVPVDAQDRRKAIGREREIEGWTAFNFPGRRGKGLTGIIKDKKEEYFASQDLAIRDGLVEWIASLAIMITCSG
ncbi:hypothetical protein H0H87_005407 [Tephrocybe sp. NHM501043]|nr:hypothetical protein H0H87_005407 [Tephrocybe sp. NHM501043]